MVFVEAASAEESGGNSRFAGGVMRFSFHDIQELRQVIDITEEEAANADWGTNTIEEFFDDLFRLTHYKTDPDLSEVLVKQSLDVMTWLRSKGVKFVANYGRQSAVVNGRRRFFGRMPVEVSGGGWGLVEFLDKAATSSGIDIHYSTRAKSLLMDGDTVVGVRASQIGQV
ncbi:MAG: FAD-binding protein, partial [Burkholderiaceae bacterium]